MFVIHEKCIKLQYQQKIGNWFGLDENDFETFRSSMDAIENNCRCGRNNKKTQNRSGAGRCDLFVQSHDKTWTEEEFLVIDE